MDLAHVFATWLHLLATVALIGYYSITGLVVLPAIGHVVSIPQQAEAMGHVERRGLPLVLVSLATFLATGIYLMVVDPAYGGLGEFGGAWATVFLVKHLAVLAMVGVGMWFDAVVVRAVGGGVAAVRRISMIAGIMTGLGAIVLLLTAVGQAIG